ncbi:hypothetical protein [Chitinophaga agri]|uniref:Uncharacterized protein n=1 Tax=Chitinophaga agri TaxID=2703787 RepID=A0A6B9ZID6_9BACT|nr:hypothetical protein [Chitinophaga agri]QHS61271.1 hypothetical protein GWR21_17200 [Chitinophaga agri]
MVACYVISFSFVSTFLLTNRKQMKGKILKFSAIGLIVFALVSNVYSSVFTYYGIKTNHLDNSVMAVTLASSTSGSSSGGSTDVTGTTGVFDAPKYTTVKCGTVYFSGSQSNTGAATVSYTTNNAGGVTVTVSFSSNGGYTGSVGPHDATMVQCIGPDHVIWCSSVGAVDACK